VKIIFISEILLSLFFLTSCSPRWVKERDILKNTRLHYAVINQDAEEIIRLISHGAEIDAVNSFGVTPLRYSVYIKNPDLAAYLISRGACVNNVSRTEPREKNNFNIIRYPEAAAKNFFLTFDLGEDDGNLDHIRKVLSHYRIKGTFFATGRFMEKYPVQIRALVMEGHIVGNHTLNHLSYYPSALLLHYELLKTEEIYKKVTGKKLTRIWRSPYLQHSSNPWMIEEAAKLGYRHIDVSLASVDWVQPGDRQYLSNEIFLELFVSGLNMRLSERAIFDAGNIWYYRKTGADYIGAIMLMHSGLYRKGHGRDFVYSLENVILHLIGSGYYFDDCSRFAIIKI
jgi:peptidoglycan/xylan/chitin deacetylase (PgdA/CDA1 family)